MTTAAASTSRADGENWGADPGSMPPTLGAWFERSMRVNAARTAIVNADGRELRYSTLDAWSESVATDMQNLGIRKGDVVAILTGNRAEFIVTDVAIARLGATKLPVNQQLPASAIAQILIDSQARAIVIASPCVELAATALAQIDRHPAVIQVDDGDGRLPEASVFPAEPRAGRGPRRQTLKVDRPGPDEPAALYYTGGTTGRPKGVVHTQRSLTSFHVAQLLEAEIRQQDRLLLVTPLAHAAGLFAQSAVLRGATVILDSGFDVESMLSRFEREAVTWTFLVPTMIYRLLDALPSTFVQFPQLTTIVYGAAPMSPDRLRTALDRFGQVFIQLYGQTECPNWGTRLVKTDHRIDSPHLLASCGQASLMVDVKILDSEGRELPPDTVGEVCLRSPYLLERYHNDPKATAEKFVGPWIRTGDIGTLDEEGYLYLKDRRADMVISGGMNVYCREVEDALMAHPDVQVAAVIGVPHSDWGEAVHAIVVTNDRELTGDVLLSWARGSLPAYALPKSVEFVDRLPETPFGKIDKKELRAPFWVGHDRAIN